jgi:photosystem II stability/assembly factor-like uncharacterized protein
MKRRRVTMLITMLMVVLVASATQVSVVLGASSVQPVPTGTLLTNTTLNGFSQVDQVDMLSASLGYALASHPLGHDRYRYFLVRTTNLGRTWTVRSEIPSDDERYPIFTDFSTFDSDPFIDFVNQNIGYVNGPDSSIYVTDDGGLTWKMVTARNGSSSYGISGSNVSVVTTTCRTLRITKNFLCKSMLREYAAGSTVPTRVTVVHDTNTGYHYEAALLAAAPHETQIINMDSDGTSTSKSLLITRNDGQTWATLDNPCATSMIDQLTVAIDGQWLLSCFHDYGMYHGTAQIFRSTNEGGTWSTVLDDTAQRNILGNLGGTSAYFFFSGDDRTLYAAMTNPAGGLEVSTDGGTTWSPDTAMADTGGQIGSLTTFGPTSALYQVFQGPMYVTTNNRTWRLLPQLPAGKYKGLSICTRTSVGLSLRLLKSGRFKYSYVDFTNDSTTPCYLDGAPIVRLMNAQDGVVGPPATNSLVDSGGDFVTLKPGGVANVSLFISPTSGYKPPSSCAVTRVSAMRVNFGAPSTFILHLGSHTISACTNLPIVNVLSVRRGPGYP